MTDSQNNAAKVAPIAEGLFTWPSDSPRLLGSRCQACKRVEFPARQACMACGCDRVEIEELPGRGTLWTWTIQRFMPKSPYDSGETAESFEPYGVGYLELPGAVRVEGRLTENDPAKLHIGMEMDVVFDSWTRGAQGDEVITYAFKPVELDS